MECYTYLRNVTYLLSDGMTPNERRFGQPFNGPIVPFGSLVEYHPITAKGPVKNPSIWKESLTWIVPRIRFVRGGGCIWKGDVLVADFEELETMDASEICSERLNAKEVIFPKGEGECIFPVVKKNCGSGGSNKIKTRLACILEADESSRLRMGRIITKSS